jgi:hypothetical protein
MGASVVLCQRAAAAVSKSSNARHQDAYLTHPHIGNLIWRQLPMATEFAVKRCDPSIASDGLTHVRASSILRKATHI